VTFKIDHVHDKTSLSSGTIQLAREDLRNPDVLIQLLRSYYATSNYPDELWEKVRDQVQCYLQATTVDGDLVRNAKWSLRQLKFDNMFCYGEGNVINFDKLKGVVGVFGVNRAGKSSIVGTIMYSLFNTTDRGPMKNMYVCNVRKPFCYSRAIINFNGTDYVIERQTSKHENRRGEVNAATALNLFKMDENGDLVDLAGEQRTDTEKVIRGLIGNADDCLMTSISAQGEINQFVEQGSAKRRQVMSRFLDLDMFDRMYDFANKDVNNTKLQLRALVDRDWNKLTESFTKTLNKLTADINDRVERLQDAHERLNDLRNKLAAHKDFTPVSKTQVVNQRQRVDALEKQASDLKQRADVLGSELDKLVSKVQTIDTIKEDHDLDSMKQKLTAFSGLESSVAELRYAHDKQSTLLKQQQRSLKILDEVPCGDMFPKCKFIKDAHQVKEKVEGQEDRVEKALEKLEAASQELELLKKDNVRDQVEKLQKLHDMHSKLKVEASAKEVDLLRVQTTLESVVSSLEPARARLEELEEALKNDENAEVVTLRSEIDELVLLIKRLDDEKLTMASQRGKTISDAEKALEEKKMRESLLQKMKVYELIANAFSRKGVPNVIVSSQLPVINAEIAKILTGIVDFTIELETDEDTDSMDVYINYGDSRRIIELASGMEKMISSVAIRVALINVSSLPKTDMFILDEGFGALDDAGVEACNRMLSTMKNYFKTVIVITHVDGVKDAADVVLEITKNEKDTRVCYE
jgi:DNA repair exonuclease SbcCD ATPase subunit